MECQHVFFLHSYPPFLALLSLFFLLQKLVSLWKTMSFHLFADGTNIYYSCKNLDDLESKLNHELKIVAEWMKSNRLALSIFKTNFILFHSKKLKPSKLFNLKIHGVSIKQVFTVKYLVPRSHQSLNMFKSCLVKHGLKLFSL